MKLSPNKLWVASQNPHEYFVSLCPHFSCGRVIWFLVVGTVPHFEFKVRIMLITYWWFSCCWAWLTLHQSLFTFSCCPASTRNWEVTELGQLTPRGCSILCHAEHQNWGELTEGDSRLFRNCLGQWVLCNCIGHHLFCTLFYISYYFLFLFGLIKFSLNMQVLPFSYSLLHHTGGVSQQLCGAVCV